jgi:hypothetical protein
MVVVQVVRSVNEALPVTWYSISHQQSVEQL